MSHIEEREFADKETQTMEDQLLVENRQLLEECQRLKAEMEMQG